MRSWSILAGMIAGLVALVSADQTRIPDYRSARDSHFYNRVYRDGGRTLYCNERFKKKTGLNVEHVYPASWMKSAAGCPGRSRKACRRASERFNRMEADLHNLFPALEGINQDRSNYTFAIIGDDLNEPDYGDCDFEVDTDSREVEPRPAARGEIARAIFYMISEYGLTIEPNLLPLLLDWHKADQVSAEEMRRNDIISGIQGTRNKYIDDPSSVAELIAAVNRSQIPKDRSEKCRIKGNISRRGKIYHLPGTAHYPRTKIDTDRGEKWFCTEEEARAAGWRRAN